MIAPSSDDHGLCADASFGDGAAGLIDERQQSAWARVLDALERAKPTIRHLGPRQDIFSFGDPCEAIHILLSGWAYVFRSLEDGQRIILQFADHGTVIGFHPERDAIARYSARTLSHSTVAAVSYEKFEMLVRDDPQVAVCLAILLSRDRNLAFDTITSFCRSSGRQRVARLLLQIALHGCESIPESYVREFTVPLTQEHIADATGLSTGHVNRTLGELRKERVVEFQYRKLRIISLGKLIAAAGSTETTHETDSRVLGPRHEEDGSGRQDVRKPQI